MGSQPAGRFTVPSSRARRSRHARSGRDRRKSDGRISLRWGITACLILTVLLITMIFCYRPAARGAGSRFRSVPILPEAAGRVAEVHVGVSDRVSAGDPIFRLESAQREAAIETARPRVAEIEPAIAVALNDLAAADGAIRSAEAVMVVTRVKEAIASGRIAQGDRLLDPARMTQTGEGTVHAAIRRIQAIMLPVRTLVLHGN